MNYVRKDGNPNSNNMNHSVTLMYQLMPSYLKLLSHHL